MLQFLAFRLSEVKLSNEHLTADLNMTMVYSMLQMSKTLCKPVLVHRQQLQQHDSETVTNGLPYSRVNMPVLRIKHISLCCTSKFLIDNDSAQ